MKKRTLTNLKIAAAIGGVALTMATLFTGTYAWFVAKTNAYTSGSAFKINSPANVDILSCYAVRYDGLYGAIAIDISSGEEKISMSEYDSVFLDRNVNTPLFLRMEITNFNTDDDLTVSIPCFGPYKNGNLIRPYLSNVVSARFTTGIKVDGSVVADENSWTGNNVSTAEVINSYKGMVSNIENTVGTPFVTVNTKQNLITLTLPAEDVFDDDLIITKKDAEDNDIDVVVVYIAFDYHVTNEVNLVSSYLASYGSSDATFMFVSDIQSINLLNEEN